MRTFASITTAAVLLVQSARVDDGGEPVRLPDDVVRTLRILHETGAPSVDELGSLVDAGTPFEVIDGLLDVLVERRVPGVDGEDEQVLNRFQQQLILVSFTVAGRSEIGSAVERLLDRSSGPNASTAAVLAIGAVGEGADLRRLTRLAFPEEEDELDPRVGGALESAVTEILERDPRGFGQLAATWQQVRPELLPVLIRAVGATSDSRGVEVLGQTILWQPEVAPLAVAQIRRLGPSPDPEINRRIAKNLRQGLDPKDADYCRAVVLVLGELEDFYAVPQLVDFLEGPPGLRDNALWALQKLSGANWGASPSWWRRWYEREMEWRLNGHERLRRQLESRSREAVVEALREYGDRRLFRHELADEVIPVLDRPERVLRTLACATLARLGSPRAVPALVAALDDADPQLREAAWVALKEITGQEHAIDSERWVELVTAGV